MKKMTIEKMNSWFAWVIAVLLSLLAVLLPAGAAQAVEEITYYHNDISGSPMLATNASGAVLWKENYRPYGDKLTQQAASATNQIGFHGKPFDDDTGLSYMQARYYEPTLGRFMGVDPVDYQEENIHSFNRYAYANNNPYKYVDPDGGSPIDVVFLAVDVGKLGWAVYTGVGIGSAAKDVAASVVGVVSPIPGTGQAIKAVRAADHIVDAARGAGKVIDASKATTKAEKTYQTYTKTHPKNGEVYSGRTSGKGTPEQNVADRDQGHHMSEKGFGPAKLDTSSSNSAAIRGREQQLIEGHGGAKSTGGTSGNAINGIGEKNKKKDYYIQERIKEFGH